MLREEGEQASLQALLRLPHKVLSGAAPLGCWCGWAGAERYLCKAVGRGTARHGRGAGNEFFVLCGKQRQEGRERVSSEEEV